VQTDVLVVITMRKPNVVPRVSGARPLAPRRLAVVFPGEPTDRVLSAPSGWLTDPIITDASTVAGADIARALSGRTVMGAAVVQPAVVALELVCWRRLRSRGIVPTLVAGQAAGEIAAWAASGAIDDDEAVKLAALRGAAVQLASLVHPVTRRSSPGGWNSIAMAPARETMQSASAQVPRFMRDIAQVSTLDGSVMAEDETPDLGEALIAPPSWRVVIDTFLRFAITDVVVLAPSRVLKNLLGDSLGKNIRVHSAEDDADLDHVAEAFELTEAAAAS
jgi:hypothetical protein